MVSVGVFFIFSNFWFCGTLLGGGGGVEGEGNGERGRELKGQKNNPKWKI